MVLKTEGSKVKNYVNMGTKIAFKPKLIFNE